MADQFTDDQLSMFRGTFSLFDQDGDGYITAKDLATVTRMFEQFPAGGVLQDMFDQFDAGQDRAVSFQDFLKFTTRRMEELKEAFLRFDLNQDGFISVKELRQVLTNLWGQLADEEADDLIRAAAVDGNGMIDYEAFIGFMMTGWPSGGDDPSCRA